MRCPNCGAKIRKGDDRCLKCGTKVQQMKEASNDRVSQARREYQPELVVYSTVFPKDLSYKRTLLWCIFFGWLGAHCYYVKRYIKGTVLSVMTVIFFICFVPIAMFWQTGDAGIFNPLVILLLESDIFVIPFTIGALAVIMWGIDLVKLITKTFPVPVVLGENETAVKNSGNQLKKPEPKNK